MNATMTRSKFGTYTTQAAGSAWTIHEVKRGYWAARAADGRRFRGATLSDVRKHLAGLDK